MNYFNLLHPWCVMRLLPEAQRVVAKRFRQRNDTEAHKRILQWMLPEAEFVIVFDLERPDCSIDTNTNS
ncbi:hypothetical protein H6F67_04215 [Microcoleus sp. FACHB-1515]|uniref:hypothetical protein n=1 Tax=Cyanophyceae TaxID=3028117 RepID=UPI0016885C8A|nr:hypothetical protein [Microcoleus sp. FACHB-1515]MBD2089059.1 hypothetical protein [Microcoleus sp. FACHB-1515]